MIKTPQSQKTSFNWGKIPLIKVLKYMGLGIGVALLITLLVFILFPDHIANTFLKDRITKAFKKAYPTDSLLLGDMHYNIWKNRLGCDSIALKTNEYKCSVVSFSVRGISWIKILWQKEFTVNNLNSSVIDAQKISLNYLKSQKELRFGMLHISVPDSELIADSIKYYSLIDDEHFFAESKFRQTRYRLDILHVEIMGLDCPGLLQGNIYSAKNININGLLANILVNMDKPYDMNSPNPQMPNEFLNSMKEIVKIDSLNIINGHLKYCERYVVKAKPGEITFNNANVSVSGIANHVAHSGITVIKGEGIFLNSGKMKVFMEIPLTSKEFSLRYSGSLSMMDVAKLNSFIEAGEHRRIKSGTIQSAKFNVNIESGHSSGSLRVEYKDLSIAVLNNKTGSEKGIFDRIASLYGKIFIIRGTNMPDEKGLMKIGETKYSRHPEDYFFQFVWFAIRNGVAEVVGFSPI
jgi:hypothetical protein